MPVYEFDPPAGSLRGHATSGMLKTGLSQGIRVVVQFASVVILSRLLLPAQFGLLAMAGPVVAFAWLFQDLGLTQAIVQKPSIEHREVSSLFFLSFGMSVALALILALAAPAVGWFYGQPEVALLTAAMGINIILGGAGTTQYALLNRRLKFGTLAIIDAASAIIGLAVSIGLALRYHSFWALYGGSVAAVLVPTVLYWWVTGWRPSWPKRNSGVRHALTFGLDVTGFNLANFFARNLDNVLIGRYWGDRPLGLYDRAYKLLLFPLQQINNPLAKVMLPVLSQMNGDPDRYRYAFLRALSQVLLMTLPGIAFLVGTSKTIIPILLGYQWADAAPIFAALGMASFVQVLNNPSGWLFMSQGRTREYMYWGLFGSVTAIISFVVGLPYGVVGVAVAYAASEYVRTPILWWYIGRSGPVRARDIVEQSFPHYVGAAASLIAVLLVQPLLPQSKFLLLGLSLVISYSASLVGIILFGRGRDTLAESMTLIKQVLRRFQTTHATP
jgi:PST family polysaccharide transporter